MIAYGRIGASPDGGMTYFLPRVVGPAKAKQLLLEDPMISPQEAHSSSGWSPTLLRRTS